MIVSTFNPGRYLEDALRSLTAQETNDLFRYEVIVVNCASMTGARELVEKFAETAEVPVRMLADEAADRDATGQRGVEQSDGEWLAFFSDNQVADSRWLLNLLHTAQRTNAQIVGGPVHLDLDDETIEELSPACRSTLREKLPYSSDRQYGDDAIPGTGNLLVSRVLLNRVAARTSQEGSGDRKLVAHARAAGFMPWYSSGAAIRHRVESNQMLPAYFRWDATSSGAGQADRDAREWGPFQLATSCFRRILSALLWQFTGCDDTVEDGGVRATLPGDSVATRVCSGAISHVYRHSERAVHCSGRAEAQCRDAD